MEYYRIRQFTKYTINEKVSPTASNRRKKEFARKGDLLTYKRKRKTIDPSTNVLPNTVDTANEGVSEPVPPTESAQATLGVQVEFIQAVNIFQGLEFETESAQAALGTQPPYPNVFPDFDEKLPIRVHHHQSTWDITEEPQVVQDFVKLKGLDRIGAISYNSYNSALISAFTESRGAGNLLSLKKLKWYYACKLEKVLSDGTATAVKKKGLTARSVARAYMMLYMTHTEIKDDDVGIHQRKETSVNEHGDTPVHESEDVAEQYDASYYEHASLSPNTHDTMPTRGRSGSFDQQITILNDQLQKLKEDKEKESEANINLREAIKEKISECDLLKETIEQKKEDIKLKRVVDGQCTLEFTDLPRQLDAKILEYTNLEKKIQVWRQS
ncbi:hypothetical protein GIB67_000560 [Kingdonia uniflora]|uniref:Uncharacterized protein n=1 Tax=Kingdonia uniflora TaxID=39325 RepID=A0A7J7MIG2_9MAGN|nr:hypothetical protein GIB67_000560 [Kingdonia uniflora]